MYYVVDRVENGVAALVCDDGRERRAPVSRLPKGTSEGDVLRYCRKRGWYRDAEKRAELESRAGTLIDKLFKKP